MTRWKTEPLQVQKRDVGRAARIGTRFARKFNLGNLSSQISEESLGINTEVKGFDSELGLTADIRGELAILGGWADRFSGFSCTVHTEKFIKTATVVNWAMPAKKTVRIKQETFMMPLQLRSFAPALSTSGVRTSPHPWITLPSVDGNEFKIPSEMGNRILLSQILKLPYVRKSIDTNLLPTAEYAGFLREAEMIKQLPLNECELLAVFRNIPVEMISHLRFLAEKNVIVYQIATEVHRTQTRIHDLAAVRDNTSHEVHLVFHRTRFKTVWLH